MPGLYFEEFSVGQKFPHPIRRTVTEADNVFFTAMTHNPAQLHLDEEYAKGTEFGTRIVNSLFTLGLMIGISVGETTLGTTVANLGHGRSAFSQAGLSWRHVACGKRSVGERRANRGRRRASSCSDTRRSTSAMRSSRNASAAH